MSSSTRIACLWALISHTRVEGSRNLLPVLGVRQEEEPPQDAYKGFARGSLMEVVSQAGQEGSRIQQSVMVTPSATLSTIVLPIVVSAAVIHGIWHARQGMAIEAAEKNPEFADDKQKTIEMPRRGSELTGVASFARCGINNMAIERQTSFLSTAEPSGATLQDDPTVQVECKGTFWSTTVNIVTGGLGAGILCLPWAAAGASLQPAIFVIACVLVVNAYTIEILVEAADEKMVFDLGSLLGLLPGKLASTLKGVCNFIIWVSMFLCLLSYFVVIGDCGMRAFDLQKGSHEHQKWRYVIIASAAVVIIPLCFLPQDKLAFTSILTVCVNIYIFFIILVDMVKTLSGNPAKGNEEALTHPACVLQLGEGAIAMVATMSQCVIIQMCVLPMYGEMRNRSVAKFRHVIGASFSALFLLFSAFSIAGSLAYGPTFKKDPNDRNSPEFGTQGNVLDNLPEHWSGTSAQAFTVLAMASVFPIMLVPMVAPIKSSSHASYANPVIVAIGLLSCLGAFLLDKLEVVNIVNGSVCVGVFVGLIPASVGYYFGGRNVVLMSVLAIAAMVLLVLGLVFPENAPSLDECWFPAWRK